MELSLNKRALAVVLIMVGVTSVVYGVFQFRQTFPEVNVESAASLTAGCNGVRAQNDPVEGPAGAVRFNCDGVAGADFDAAITSARAGTMIATFSLAGTGYSSLGIVAHSAANCNNPTPLISGTPILLTPGDYDYCASYSSTPPAGSSFGSFPIDWSTP